MRKLELPSWAKVIGQGKVEADADSFYKEWLALLGVPLDSITQYDLECALQCAKLDIQFAVAGTDFVPSGGALCIYIKDTTKEPVGNAKDSGQVEYVSRWAQCRYPKGRGAAAASKGGEARALFKKIRNVPSI